MSGTDRVVIVGEGYVGLPLTVRAVEVGMDVVALDTDERRIKALRDSTSYIEDIADERVAAAMATGRLHPSTDPAAAADFDLAVITVPTPLTERLPDLSHVRSATEALAPSLTAGATVILESTTYPGTTEELVGATLQQATGLRPGVDFHLGYSPERIDPGNTTWTLEKTPKVVSGLTPACLERVQGFYDRIVAETVPVRGPREAEMCKLLENTFRHVNIALINELAMFAADLDVDIWDVIRAAATKPFGFMSFSPGPGVGGHCLPIDPSFLSWKVEQSLGTPFRFVELANDVNEHMPDYVLRRVNRLLNDQRQSINGSRLLLVGYAYKRNTGDARESPSVLLASQLMALGAHVVGLDPHVDSDYLAAHSSEVVTDAGDAGDCDGVIMLVDHDDVDLAPLADAPWVLDTRGILDLDNVERL